MNTLQISNLNTTSTTKFNNLNSLSSQSYFLTNYTNLSSLNVSTTTKLNGFTIKNNSTYTSYIGLGGTAMGGNYANNFFIESAASSIIFNTNGRTSTSTPNMIVHSSGNVGIGTTTPNNILQVGDGARLRISNGVSDYSLIGTKDVDDATNTRIVISGNTRASPFNGNIDYVATSGIIYFILEGQMKK